MMKIFFAMLVASVFVFPAQAGDDIAKDIELAKLVTMLKVDCNTGNHKCCAKLGDMYFSGKAGLPRDVRKAEPFLNKACNAGIHLSCQQLRQTDTPAM